MFGTSLHSIATLASQLNFLLPTPLMQIEPRLRFFLSFPKTNILAVKLKEINWRQVDKRIPLEDLWTLSDAKL